ncbi:MAG: glycerol-3-phosphate dehydrogenase/oxidase [Bacteroidota bacterium]
MTRFSAVDRKNHLEKIQAESFDVLVIGGGATGCGIALDAASRGLKTLLLEKGDFASGTSSKSTKLIHGGLRYLKQFEFGLVRETGTERAIVHRLAPHLVLPEKMLLPIVEGGTYSKLAASFGVMLYDILAGVTSDDRRKMLSAADTSAKEPLLRTAGLKGSCYFAEYRTDDARLTIELMKSAVAEGAKALNYCEVKDFVLENGKIVGVMARDVLTHQSFRILAHQVVSAAGPWVDGLRKRDHSLQGKRLHLTRGTHIVFPHEKLPLRQSVYFDVPDGRMVFAIPRGRATYVGTTDTNYQGDPDAVRATQEDVDYLLHAARHAFPEVRRKAEGEDLSSNAPNRKTEDQEAE